MRFKQMLSGPLAFGRVWWGNGGKRYRKASDLSTTSQILAKMPRVLCFRIKTALVIGGRDESDDYINNGLNYFLARGSSCSNSWEFTDKSRHRGTMSNATACDIMLK